MNDSALKQAIIVILTLAVPLSIALFLRAFALPESYVSVTPPTIKSDTAYLDELPMCETAVDKMTIPVVFRIRMPVHMVGQGNDRRVSYKLKKEYTNNDDGSAISGNSNKPLKGNEGEPFHVFLSTLPPALKVEDTWAEIRVVIQDRNKYRFASVRHQGKLIEAIAIDSRDPPGMLCRGKDLVLDAENTDRQIAVFYAKIGSPKPIPDASSFNIIFSASDSLDTPVIIDPKIRNNG